ncbi:hypothetical protein F5Y16DRAFT_143410 [Xylariaceae sp. FL0255]|nr:hypothetical protein F5Y16DRAFT_143410 [Xylariaceae sp. FL0255]
MGIHPKLDLQRPSAFSVTPPGLASPASTLSFPKAPEEKTFGQIVPISPPMSHHESSRTPDMSPGKSVMLGQSQKERRAEPSHHQQLPSLSSLFASSQQIRPLNSPVSDRPSPLPGFHSPLDRPLSSSANPERPYSSSSSYFPSVSPTLTQSRPIYEPRLPSGRPSLPSISQSFPGPLSPPIREYDAAPQGRRTDVGTKRRWTQTSMAESRRADYGSFTSQPSTPSYRSASEQHRVPLPSLSQSLGYDTVRQGDSDISRLSPTLSPGSNTERTPVKDGLGPKIWTGTHFLPRFLRQAEVPGEGLCYFYDDGTHCKTVIDGEPVNAHWGVTKAGKPRKRLAIACLTCREKKIKCDPDFPRCVQCEKFGRVCKFKNAPRGGHNATSPTSSQPEHEESRQLGIPQRIVDFDRPRTVSSGSVSPALGKLSHPSPELPSLPIKRQRFAYEQYAPPPTSYPSPMIPRPEYKPANTPWQHRELPRIHELPKWQPDRYLAESHRPR